MTNKKTKKTGTKKDLRKPDNLLTMSELAEASGVRYGTIKYYSQIEILPFKQEGERLRKYYNRKEAVKRLNEIKKLKDKRLTIEEIKDYFKRSATSF
jgi:DNA-binding transcriptional MerR regulator